jgi:16S rRNA (adenine1518-N6/adenine1519-N6)-dimethyltransferase
MINLLKSYCAEKRGTKKSLGQHFLIDKKALSTIVEQCNINKGDVIIEIGAGCGILTQLLLEKGEKVVAVEIDKELCDFLERYLFYYPNLTIINSDFLDYSIKGDNNKIVGNLPYNRAAHIVIHTIDYIHNIKQMILMFQKEVAERLISSPSKRSYGFLSVLIQYYYDIDLILDIKGSSFWPTTKVDSTVLSFKPKNSFPIDPAKEKIFFKFIKDCFKMKRKTLKNNLKGYQNIERLTGYFQKYINVRAEELTIDDFIDLFEQLFT